MEIITSKMINQMKEKLANEIITTQFQRIVQIINFFTT